MMMVAETSKDPQGGGGARLMEKPTQEQIQQQQQQQPLKCPRCESTNTKFCYYNNYSLSQPRHFCKACKRYWTRGGTLRSVPVGGGCRKNKRIRRINTPNFSTNSPSNNNSSSNATNMSESSNTFNHSLNPSSGGGGGAHFISPLLYGLPTNLVHPNHHHGSSHEAMINGFQFSSSYDNLGGINGLGFSSPGGMILGRNGYSSSSTPKDILQDLISNSNPTFHGSNKNSNTTTTCSTSTTTLPTMSSMSALLTSSSLEQHQQKFNFETLFPYESDLQMKGVGSHGRDHEGVYMKEDSVKLDGDDHPHHHGQCQIQNGYDDQIHGLDHHHQQQPMGETDPSILWNNNNNNNNSNGTSIGVNWLDPNYSSLGSSSSVPSLI